MIGLSVLVKELLVVVNQSLYCASFIPQIIKNFRAKSGESLSDLFLLAMLNSYVCFCLYFFCLGMPVGYKMAALFQLVATIFLIVQRFVYRGSGTVAGIATIYGINTVLALAALVCASWYPFLIGNMAGWAAVVLIIISRIPQIIKIQYERSVGEFSKMMVLLIGAASVMEITLALLYKFPVQTLCSSSWALVTCVLFLVQFKLYGAKKS